MGVSILGISLGKHSNKYIYCSFDFTPASYQRCSHMLSSLKLKHPTEENMVEL